jgi:hypothetical protein
MDIKSPTITHNGGQENEGASFGNGLEFSVVLES